MDLKALCARPRAGITKTFLIMKWMAIFLLVTTFTVSANSNAQQVTLAEKDAKLERLFAEIKRQTGYVFLYTSSTIEKAKRVSINVVNGELENVLNRIFSNQPLTWSILERTIIVKPKLVYEIPSPETVALKINGRITNDGGEPVTASVLLKGTQNGTTTDGQGYYQLSNVPADGIIVVTGVSIEPMEVAVNGRTEINVQSKRKIVAQEEVVISGGYYKTTNRMKTGSIARATSADFENVPVTSPLLALQGKIAGVEIRQTGAAPGAAAKVQIRGMNAISRLPYSAVDGNLPLYVIDGVPVNSAPVESINLSAMRQGFDPLVGIDPNNIESIDFLKDADATAIYGSRGANGVVLVTTKGARKTNGIKVGVNFYRGVSGVANRFEMLETKDYLMMRREALANDGLAPGVFDFDLNMWDTTRNVDWQKELLSDQSHTTNASATFSAGTDRTMFTLNASYFGETMMYPGDFGFKRYSIQSSFTHTSADRKFNAQFTNNYGINRSDLFNSDHIMTNALGLPPNAPPLYKENGELNWGEHPDWGATWINPMAGIKSTSETKMHSIVSNLALEYSPIENLSIQTIFGVNRVDQDEKLVKPISSLNPWGFEPLEGTLTLGTQTQSGWILEPRVNYKRSLGKHAFDLTAGLTFQHSTVELSNVTGYGFSSDAFLGTLAGARQVSGFASNTDYKYGSIYARLGYVYDKKWLLNLTGRRDGSSRFGPDSRYGNFGSIGAGWIFAGSANSERRSQILSFGKIRGSYGITGNDNIGDQMYVQSYRLGSTYGGNPSLVPTALFNSDYAWEKIRKAEVAIESEWFNNKLALEIAYYQNRSIGQLVNYPVPATTGFETILANFEALIENKGWEFTLRSMNISRKNFTWNTSFTLSINRNKLVDFPGIETSPYSTIYQVGKPLSIQYTFVSTGVDPGTGLYSFEDLDGNNVFNHLDKQFTKALETRYFGGMQNQFRYKNWALMAFFNVSDRTDLVRYFYSPGNRSNQPVHVLERWRKPGDITDVQKFSTSLEAFISNSNLLESDAALERIFYVRLRTVSLSYTLPQKILQRLKITNAKFYIEGQNLGTWTNNKKVWDPETVYNVPPLRTTSIGFQLNF